MAQKYVSTEKMDPPIFWEQLQSKRLRVVDALVEVISGPHKGLCIRLEQEITEIGRSEIQHLALFNDNKVSTNHAELILTEDGVRIKDCESRNGTYLEGHRIYDAHWKPWTEVKIGESTLLLKTTKEHKEIQVSYFDNSRQLVGKSKAMRLLFSMLERLGYSDVPVMLTGETGTGKTSIAKALHKQSKRSEGPFVHVNCAAIPENLLEAELFGYEKGSFTGAGKQHKGYFEQAESGTLFLDELGELPVHLQSKLLKAIEEKKVRRLGGTSDIDVDFRVLTATNQDLKKQMGNKQFREDLFFRLAVIDLKAPPLRERMEDIPLLAKAIIKQIYPEEPVRLTPEASLKLQQYHWPGNIRELGNIIQRAYIYATDGKIDEEHIILPSGLPEDERVTEFSPVEPQPFPQEGDTQILSIPLKRMGKRLSLKAFKEEAERILISYTLEETVSKTEASDILGVNRSWLYKQIKKYGLGYKNNTNK